MKLIALVNKKQGMSHADFERYWLQVHTTFSTKIPGMRGYRINIAIPDEQHTALFDGSAEIWWDSPQAFRDGNTTAEGVIAGDDTRHFCERVQFMYTEEHIVLPDPSITGSSHPKGST
jgi:uncharacterized protein (TIGR02118 family)